MEEAIQEKSAYHGETASRRLYGEEIKGKYGELTVEDGG